MSTAEDIAKEEEKHDSFVHYPPGFSRKDIVSWGVSGLVLLDRSTQTVVKTPLGWGKRDVRIEHLIYERFQQCGGHPDLLRYHGICSKDPFSIRLEYASHGPLRAYLEEEKQDNMHSITTRQRLRWTMQITEALAFLHRAGVIHGDFTTANVLLDERLNAKVADFAGSSLDGSPLLIGVTESHCAPGDVKQSVQGDLFALGSNLYTIMIGKPPYAELSGAEIEKRYALSQWADLDEVGVIGLIIRRCWEHKYDTADVIAQDLRDAFSAAQDAPTPAKTSQEYYREYRNVMAAAFIGVCAVCLVSRRIGYLRSWPLR